MPIDKLNKEPARPDTMTTWASQTLARPVVVNYTKLHTILFVFIGLFFIIINLLIILVNGLTPTSGLLVTLNGLLLLVLYYIWRRARWKAACFLDVAGVTRGDKRRFSWNELRSVDYLIVIRRGGASEILWRIELVFNNEKAWLIPQRIRNLEEINQIVNSIPAAHQKRLA